MVKRKFFSSSVLIVLLIACIVFCVELFGCTPDMASGSVAGGGIAAQENGEFLPPSVDDWVLPIVVSITGAESEKGFAAAWGFGYGVKVVNEQGGIRGVTVSIAVRDIASDNAKISNEVVSAAKDALIVVGPPTESLYKASETAFFNAGMPSVGAATDSQNREAYQPFAISCISEPDSAAVSAAGAWIEADNFSSVCVLYSPVTQERTEYIEKALFAGGKQVAEKIALGNEAFDAASVAEKAALSGADAFYIDTNGEDTLRIIKQLRFIANETGSGGQSILCGPQAADQELLESDEDGDMIGVRVWSSADPGKDIEKRKAFNEAFIKNEIDPELFDITVDYYQSAIMLKQAIDTLGLTGSPDSLTAEREKLANYLFNTEEISTDHGNFVIESGSKQTIVNLYKITENGFQ